MNTQVQVESFPPIIETQGLKLIGIVGNAGSGKDTIADYIRNKVPNTYSIPFAAALKDGCARLFGIPESYFYDSAIKEVRNNFWGVSPREIAQFVGSELFRDAIAPLVKKYAVNSFWVQRHAGFLSNILKMELGPDADGEATFAGDWKEGDNILIPDVRFQNEVDYIAANGGWIIDVIRPGATGKVGLEKHQSEELDLWYQKVPLSNFYRIVNDGTLEDLHANLDGIIKQIFPKQILSSSSF